MAPACHPPNSPWLFSCLELPAIPFYPAVGPGGCGERVACCQVRSPPSSTGWADKLRSGWDGVFHRSLQGQEEKQRVRSPALLPKGLRAQGGPLPLTPWPAPGRGCPYPHAQLHLCWLSALCYLPSLLSRPTGPDQSPATPTPGLPLVSRGVNEAITGTPSLGFGSCPRLTVEITIFESCSPVLLRSILDFWAPSSLGPHTPPGLFSCEVGSPRAMKDWWA